MESKQSSIVRPAIKASDSHKINPTIDNESLSSDLPVASHANANANTRSLTQQALSELDNEQDDEWQDDDEDEAWESESLYADALHGMEDQSPSAISADICTPREVVKYRTQLRTLGEEEFIKVTVEAGAITAKKLCTAFGIRSPAFLEGAPDAAYYPLLGLGISRELSKRRKLPQYNTIEDAVALLQESKNIIVLTGAGISTSLGIPDFRSKETGLYSKLEYLGLSDPQEVFDINLFREDPSIFYSIAKDILPDSSKFSPTHGFIQLLQEKDKLLTNYSQNIDNLESNAGILPEKLIQCHGSFATATCMVCKYKVECAEIYESLKDGKIASCSRCVGTPIVRNGDLKRKRNSKADRSRRERKRGRLEDTSSDDDDNLPEVGIMKPDITFFGEDLPEAFHDRLTKHDHELVDLVIVIGTSLTVAPVSEIVGFLPSSVPQIYISRTPVGHVDFDIEMLGDCDVVVAELCRRAGWDLSHEMIPKDRKVNVELQEDYESRYRFALSEDRLTNGQD